MFSGKAKIIGVIHGVICAGLITTSVYFFVKENAFLNECKLIKCRVVQIDEPYKGKAILELKDINGTYKPFYYAENYDAGEDELEYKLNEIYEVYYFPADPNRSEMKDFIVNHETSFILFIIGISFIFDLPVLLYVSNMKSRIQSQSTNSETGYNDIVK